ncbi:MAG: cation:proton antiporter [Halofilum sp. (in: g-proteobacteria)]|nr:cation:proton antiporter [Halofilum sp. (in: g-proteobacteria)]
MDSAIVLTTLGALLLAGLAVEWAGRRLPLPRVTLLLAFGFVIGPEGAALLPPAAAEQWFEPVTTLALVMVGFLVGERFSLERLRERGRVVVTTSVIEALGTATVTALGLLALGAPAPLALLLGGVACATAPASTYDVVTEQGAAGPFTDTLLGVIGIDDAWGLLIFSLAAAAVAATLGDAGGPGFVVHALREIGGALGLGAVLGVAAGLLTQRIQAGEPTVLEAAGDRPADRGPDHLDRGVVHPRGDGAGDRHDQRRPPPRPGLLRDRASRVALHGAVLRARRRLAAPRCPRRRRAAGRRLRGAAHRRQGRRRGPRGPCRRCRGQRATLAGARADAAGGRRARDGADRGAALPRARRDAAAARDRLDRRVRAARPAVHALRPAPRRRGRCQEAVRVTMSLLRAHHSHCCEEPKATWQGRFRRSLDSHANHHARLTIAEIASLCHALATAQITRTAS